jgi:NAD(P)H-flavin reductase
MSAPRSVDLGSQYPSWPPPSAVPSAAEQAAALIRESWARVEPRADELAKEFYARLFASVPEVRDLFPVNMQAQRSRLMRAVVHSTQLIDRPDELRPFLAQLGRDHRKFGVVAQHYLALGQALIAAVRHYSGPAWSSGTEDAWREAFTAICTVMSRAAEAETGPASWMGRVISHQRLDRDIAVVHLQTAEPIPYRAGQYLSVETPQRPRMWRYLSPANAPRDDGVIEFHVSAVPDGWVSRSVVAHARRGDVWRIGPPMGLLPHRIEHAPNLLMVAGGTGAAPVTAILEQLGRQPQAPRTHVFLGGRQLGDLYALTAIRDMSYRHTWLTVTPVVEHDERPRHAEPDPGHAGVESGTLADAVTRHGSWPDHDVVVSGSPQMVRATVSRMLVAGTSLDRIRYDPFVAE